MALGRSFTFSEHGRAYLVIVLSLSGRAEWDVICPAPSRPLVLFLVMWAVANMGGGVLPSARWAVSLASLHCRWYTHSPAMVPTPSGSTRCWTPHKCRVAGAKPTPRTKCSEWAWAVRWSGLWADLGTQTSPPHFLLCALTAPSNLSSSGPSTRCWPSCTSFPAGTMMASLPRTSARFAGAQSEGGWASALLAHHTLNHPHHH